MKALTLFQPWASFVAAGVKRVETRGWATRYRGELAIHASARIPANVRASWARWDELLWRLRMTADATPELKAFGLPRSPDEMPLGVVLAVVRLVDVRPVRIPNYVPFPEFGFDTAAERLLGDYSSYARHAWLLDLPRRIDPPVTARGRLGLWDWQG